MFFSHRNKSSLSLCSWVLVMVERSPMKVASKHVCAPLTPVTGFQCRVNEHSGRSDYFQQDKSLCVSLAKFFMHVAFGSRFSKDCPMSW